MLICLFFLINLNIANAAQAKKCELTVDGLNLCMVPKFVDGVSRKSDSKFTLLFKDLKTQNVVELDKQPVPKLWMVMKNGHEHGSEVVTVKRTKKGIYLIENVWFLMQGEWNVFVDITLNKVIKKSAFKVCVKRKKHESYLGKCR
jgi:hypothetical protein